MPSDNELSRRHFIAASSAAVAAGAIGVPSASAKSVEKSQLAIDGGAKAVQEKLPPYKRWGDAERDQLNATLEQNSLLYWQGPQTALFTKRFREFCPLEHVMTCSSGTAALHIAVAAAGIGPGNE